MTPHKSEHALHPVFVLVTIPLVFIHHSFRALSPIYLQILFIFEAICIFFSNVIYHWLNIVLFYHVYREPPQENGILMCKINFVLNFLCKILTDPTNRESGFHRDESKYFSCNLKRRTTLWWQLTIK